MSRKIEIGDRATLRRAFSADDVSQFAELSADRNPIHLDADYAAGTQFKQRIVHGALLASLFSALLGEQLPGHGAIYMSQNTQFKAPVFLDMEVIATVEVTAINAKKPFVTLSTICTDTDGKVLVTGEAMLYVPWLREPAAS